MSAAPLPPYEDERLARLRSYAILDTEPEERFDSLVRLASKICGTPIALVSLVDAERQWFKSRYGLAATETPRDLAFCAHAILKPEEVLVVTDPFEDQRFKDNPLVTSDPNIRFYAGAPLVTKEGMPLGTLCVIDQSPRQVTESQLESLRILSRQVVSQIELHKANRELLEFSEGLARANHELKLFTSMAAHDLQEPLRNLALLSDMLAEDFGEELQEKAAVELGFIKSSSERMQSLVTNLLVLSRTASGELAREPLRLEDCVRTAMDSLGLLIRETGARIEVESLPTVEGDVTLLTQLFQNLIGNALKFVREGRPEIHVSSAIEDGETVFSVRDNGIGIDPRYAAEIFAPFKRAHGGEFRGTGIGLAISYKAVERHGGRIWVESEPGRGSTFKFTLGCATAPVLTQSA